MKLNPNMTVSEWSNLSDDDRDQVIEMSLGQLMQDGQVTKTIPPKRELHFCVCSHNKNSHANGKGKCSEGLDIKNNCKCKAFIDMLGTESEAKK